MGILAASTLVSMLQGFLLVAFTRLVLGVRWGSLGVVVLVLLGASLLAQLVNLALLLVTRNYGACGHARVDVRVGIRRARRPDLPAAHGPGRSGASWSPTAPPTPSRRPP